EPGKGVAAVPVLAAGYVTHDGKLTRSVGAKVSAERTGQGKYTINFDHALPSIPIVVVSADETRDGIVVVRTYDVNKNRFVVLAHHIDQNSPHGHLLEAGFNYMVLEAGARTP